MAQRRLWLPNQSQMMDLVAKDIFGIKMMDLVTNLVILYLKLIFIKYIVVMMAAVSFRTTKNIWILQKGGSKMITPTESGKMKWDEHAFPVLRIGSLFASLAQSQIVSGMHSTIPIHALER